MSLKETIQSIATNLEAAYAAVADKGGSIPPEPNLYNLAGAISSMRGGTGGAIGDLGDLQTALRAGMGPELFPVGTEFEDTWDGQDQPLIIVNYQQVKKADGTWVDGVILQRKYASDEEHQFPTTTSISDSSIYAYLNSEYFNKSSDMVKSALCETMAPCSQPIIGYSNTDSKWFLPCLANVCSGVQQPSYGALQWAYWKQRTGITDYAGDSNINPGRIMKTGDGVAVAYWLYATSGTGWSAVDKNGAVGVGAGFTYNTNRIAPAFAIY